MTRRALTYNVSRKHNSQIKATLIWTVNDLLAYEMVSGWSIHRKLSCLYYMHHNKAFILFNSVKLFSYCYRGFCQVIINLEIIKKDFLKGKVEKDISSLVLLNEELYDEVSKYESIVFSFNSKKKKFHDSGMTHNWIKQNIFLGAFFIKRLVSSVIDWMS